MTQSACSADRGGDAPQSTHDCEDAISVPQTGASASPDTHLSLDGGWDSVVSLAGVVRLDLANMDGTEPLKHAQNVRELRLARVSGSMEVSHALARLTIVDSPIACTNPQGRDLPNLAEVAVSCGQALNKDGFKWIRDWGPLVDVLKGAQELRKLTLDNYTYYRLILPEMPSLKKLETLELFRTKGSVYLPPSIRTIEIDKSSITKLYCDVELLPYLKEFTMYSVSYVDISLSQILQKATGLQKLVLVSKFGIVSTLPDISKLKLLETLNLAYRKGEIYIPQGIRSVTLTNCKITKFQCDAELLPNLLELTVDNAFSSVTFLGEKLQMIVQISPKIRQLQLTNNYRNHMILPDISKLIALEYLSITGMQGQIYLPHSIRSVSIYKCKITKFSCDTETLPNLLELTVHYMKSVDPSLTMVLQKADKLQKLILGGTFKDTVRIWKIYLQPSVTELELKMMRLSHLIQLGTPKVKILSIYQVLTDYYEFQVLVRIIKSRTIIKIDIQAIGKEYGYFQRRYNRINTFNLRVFIQREGVYARMHIPVGRHYIQRDKTMYQKTHSVDKIVVLPANLVAFVYRQKIIPLASELTMLAQTLLE
ncbi:hypothetical protein SS50377_25179 [Spironucleus salmonicida]|uniref:Leucine rich repeats-containing protein n=1 Tax=Spironucleus salmonicida TaxID=348837 RepID=V6LZJ9_9EUKA|nr:hypothetical protein SS50377_25179 [Spironucleus salmonicida]|eukprot:EST46264.1 hypothetical protein SS50377_13741 [Spironucleus salmonicida]